MMSVGEEKAALRIRYRKERRERYIEHDFLNLIEIPEVASAIVIASYFSINDEPSTTALNQALLDLGKVVALPAINGNELQWRIWDGTSINRTPKIPEAMGGEIARTTIELIFVPALRVDRRGFRLGQGGGFYDRELLQLQAWSCALVHPDEISSSDLPTEDFDVAVNAFATPDLITRIRT